MGYEAALKKAWEDLVKLKPGKDLSVKFLADEYAIDTQAGKIISLSCNIPAKDFAGILILHYLARRVSGLPPVSREWLNFRELSGVEGYSAAFRKRCIEPLIRKYGNSPLDREFLVDAFEGVPALVKIWRKDEEFGADANIFFDATIKDIFCTEDIIVLAGFVAASL